MCKIYADIGVTIMNTVVAEATRAVPVILKSAIKKTNYIYYITLQTIFNYYFFSSYNYLRV